MTVFLDTFFCVKLQGEISMKQIVRENINAPYSLHDMNITALEAINDNLIVRTQSGMVKTSFPYTQTDGYVEFHNVQWKFSYVYLFDFCGNAENFTGEKMLLKDFISQNSSLNFIVMDQTYGYNSTRYSGFMIRNDRYHEWIMEVCHEGAMVFWAEE